ncbi:hypothetical protein EJ05DRAFT_485134 [Pseudovirgaria hyperparasitica]|uniref:DUF8035 domain-containing protein n=1 Tax=Pseudovirgaria hyperparasitica TaxID=470096 RepID=A0A6A6WB39_9PEZI|nr:uncharacterized protein EJ05DRAFT_485134 [Pseudovirgaria hyperparasitica]KAF2759056.1 hypothetical protein EJ05DRAFT_485134 [Pseudovirgaria hyperparasitica]
MSRRYPTAELYEERQKDFYRDSHGGRSQRSYDELDVELRESSRRDYGGDPRRSQPDFLREDYGRTTAGPLTIRKSHTEDFDARSRASSAKPRPREHDVDREEIIIRNERRPSGRERGPPPPRETDVEREEIVFRERRGPPPPREVPREVERDEIIYRRREEDVESRATSRRPPPPPPAEEDTRSVKTNRSKTTRGRDVDKEEITIRRTESRGPPRESVRESIREEEREEIRFRTGNGPRGPPGPPPSHRGGDVDKEEIIFRHEERESGPPSRPREVDRDEIIFRHEERSSSPPPPPKSARSTRSRAPEREEIIFRDEHSRGPRGRDVHEDTIVIRPRERSLPPPRLVAREREDFVYRRREQRPPSPPSPPPPPQVEKQEIIIRRTERSPSSSPSRSPSPPPPPPEPQPIMRPPIIQEIITHHRHIDHGVERARPLTPPPPPPEPPKDDDFELSIHRRHTSGGKSYDEDITFESSREKEPERSKKKDRKRARSVREDRSEIEKIEIKDNKDDSSGDEKGFELSITRHRSQSAAPRERDREVAHRRPQPHYEDDIQAEADYYNRKALDRGYPGEAYNGATKDWGLVDVPPGTRRVRLDGQGGAGQEISWERYSGNRRSKFITDDGEYATDFGSSRSSQKAIAPPHPPKPKEDMWTEVTKDLVLEDAIKTMGYEYEETDSFFYVMEYLRYEDVLQLVELSDDIRRDRRSRIKEIQWEREEIRHPAPRSSYDEFVFEREVIHDHRGKRYR